MPADGNFNNNTKLQLNTVMEAILGTRLCSYLTY